MKTGMFSCGIPYLKSALIVRTGKEESWWKEAGGVDEAEDE